MRDKKNKSRNPGNLPPYEGEEQVLDPEVPRFDSMSVVANSGQLSGSGLGTAIDGSDAVVRMNAAPVRGFEDDVGERTTFRFVNGLLQKGKTLNYTSTPERWLETVREHKLILMPLDERSEESAREMVGESNDIYTFRSAFSDYINNDVKHHVGKTPSTGILATLFALHVSDRVRLFGFGFHQEPMDQRHYWEDWDKSHDGSHNWLREKALIEALEKSKDRLHVHGIS